MTVEEIVGGNVRQRRDELGMTQEELGEALGAYLDRPWSRQAVSAAEKGRRDWRAVDLVAAAAVLKVGVGRLVLPGLDDEVDFPSQSVPARELPAFTITKDTPAIAKAADVVELLRRHLTEAAEGIDHVRQLAELVGALFVRASGEDSAAKDYTRVLIGNAEDIGEPVKVTGITGELIAGAEDLSTQKTSVQNREKTL